jgi:hypothetical protein
VRPPAIDDRTTETDRRPADETIPAQSQLRPIGVRLRNSATKEQPPRSPTDSSNGGNGRRDQKGAGRHDEGRTASQHQENELKDTISECALLSVSGSANTPPRTRGEGTEVSGLPGLFRFGLISFNGVDRTASDGYSTKDQQFPR